MTTTAPPPTSQATPPDLYWRVVQATYAEADSPRRRARLAELLRLQSVVADYRERHFPALPAVTVDAGECMASKVLAMCSPIGSWGQGIAITVRAALLEPITPEIENQDRRSLVWRQPLRLDAAGERLRQLEVNLVLLHELVHAEHEWLDEQGQDVGNEREGRNYGGHGRWFLARCNEIWRVESKRLGLPFAPVRHSRVKRERAQQFVREDNPFLQPFTALRTSCAQWPLHAIAAPWTGHIPADLADHVGLNLLPGFIAEHHRQALAGTNAAGALVELPAEPSLTVAPPKPLPAPPTPTEVVVDPEAPATTFPVPFDAAGARAALRSNLSGPNLATYIELARLIAVDLLDLDPEFRPAKPEPQPKPPAQPRAGVPRDVDSVRARTEENLSDLAHHAERRIAEAIARRPALGVVIDALRRWGSSLPADVRQALTAELDLKKPSALNNLIYRGRSLLIAAGTPPRRFEIGTLVALRDQPAVTGTIAAITGKRAQIQIHGSQNWLDHPLDQLEFLGSAAPETKRPNPGPAAQAAIERLRARRQSTATT